MCYGHREMDLAAHRRHDEVPAAFWEAYAETYLRDAGSEARIPLYQLNYLMVKTALGEDRTGRLDEMLRRYLA